MKTDRQTDRQVGSQRQTRYLIQNASASASAR